jgi:hypothetical protein
MRRSRGKSAELKGPERHLLRAPKRVVARRTEAGRCDGVMVKGICSERVKTLGHEKAAIVAVI